MAIELIQLGGNDMHIEKDNQEITKMEVSLNRMEYQLQAQYCEMGKSILELVDAKQKVINKLVDDIIETRRQLAVVKKEIQCEECMAYNTSDSKYCKRCGCKLTEIVKKED